MIELVSGMPAPRFGDESSWVLGSELVQGWSGSCVSFDWFEIFRVSPKMSSPISGGTFTPGWRPLSRKCESFDVPQPFKPPCRILNISQPYRLPRSVTGIDLQFRTRLSEWSLVAVSPKTLVREELGSNLSEDSAYVDFLSFPLPDWWRDNTIRSLALFSEAILIHLSSHCCPTLQSQLMTVVKWPTERKQMYVNY
jgi:hypothetical protein